MYDKMAKAVGSNRKGGGVCLNLDLKLTQKKNSRNNLNFQVL